jgi:lysophospholipase L1-like esterase
MGWLLRVFYVKKRIKKKSMSNKIPFIFAVVLAVVPVCAVCVQARDFGNVMPLGDSITCGIPILGGYRDPLYQLLTADGHTLQFVGTETALYTQLLLDNGQQYHQGIAGWTIEGIYGSINGWMAATNPDLILLMIGTNDCNGNVDMPKAPARLDALVERIFTTKPTVRLLLATIVPASNVSTQANIDSLNLQIPGIVTSHQALGRNIQLVPMHKALTAPDDLADGLHPNAGGYNKMANTWFPAMIGGFNPNCAGLADFNCNGIIDMDDFSYMAGVWLTDDPTADIFQPADNLVDLSDLLVLVEEWLSDSMIAYWKLDETTGAVAADDSVPGKYDGMLVNMDDSDWVAGKIGNALDFDGVNDYVVVDNVCAAIAGREEITVSAWVKASALNTANQSIISINTSNGNHRLLLGTQANSATLSLFDGAWHDTATTVIDGTWHHVVYVLYDTVDVIYVYIDGNRVLSFYSTVSVAAGDLLSLGQKYGTGLTTEYFYQGQLDEVKIHRYALDAATIRRIYDPSGLIAYWKLDETTGFVAADDAIYGYNGTLVNMYYSAWVPGKTGNALDFDGVNDYVTITGYKGISGGANRTCCAWIKTTYTPGEILTWGNNDTGRKWIIRVNETGALRAEVGNGYIYGTTPVNDGNWHHIAVVLNNDGTPDISEVLLYVDGVLETISGVANRQIDTASAQDVAIGVYTTAPTRFFHGQIDEVRIYDRALTATEIAQIVQ